MPGVKKRGPRAGCLGRRLQMVKLIPLLQAKFAGPACTREPLVQLLSRLCRGLACNLLLTER